MTHDFIPEKWNQILNESLKSESIEERIFALDYLSQQSSLTAAFARELMPMIVQSVVHHDVQVRYFARRARNHILDCFPEIETGSSAAEAFSLDLKDGQQLSPQQILLHKMRLGSRYVVFEAMERLTESGDPVLVSPLINYLKDEKDEYKVSYLLRLLGRIDDPRIPELLETYLDHEDARIVANAVEALSEFDRPEMVDRFADFATSSDNRIRANAIKGLYRYSPALAESHISEMVKSHNIALQDSGVYLLRIVRPSNLAELLEIAHHSRYATVRLKALDIQPPSPEETEQARVNLTEEIELPDPRRDMVLLTASLITGVVLLLIADNSNKRLLSLLFLGIGVVTLLMPDKTRTSIQKTSLSMGFISSLAWGNTRLMVLPALMGLWLTWTDGAGSGKTADKEANKESHANIFAWFFAVGAIIITQLFQEELSQVLTLAARLADSTAKASPAIQAIVGRQSSFEITIFAFVAAMTIAIMKLDKWLPTRDANAQKSPQKRLIVTTVVCLGIVFLLNLFHTLGVNFQIKVGGYGSAAGVLKHLLP
ncbi:MAG: HEAT repeat domain-containing protein [Erysipelotrichia bacterium]|nr:HEAT repeat domain-containing protein [Erysipelotrichia bacterium]